MDMNKITAINDYCWQTKTTDLAIKLFGSENIISSMDEKVLEQISNVAKLPGLVGYAMTMPDAHWGYGFPIGGVAAFDAQQGGIISAGGVGFDISCGIRCLRTDLTLDAVMAKAEELAEILFITVPSGVGIEGNIRLSPKELDDVLAGGAKWAVQQGFGVEEDLQFVEERGQIPGAIPNNVSQRAKERQRGEMGTLGSGNHYLEVQVVEQIFDHMAAKAYKLQEGTILISIHCGSRGLGHQIGSEYLVSLAKEAHKFGLTLPDRELACAPILSDEGQRYLGAMRAGINCALANRQIITHLSRVAVNKIIPSNIETFYDVSHNTCKVENHEIDGIEHELYIHRKGATRAFGPFHPDLPLAYQSVGQPVIIGGSMGTGSYVLAGNSSEQNRAFSSASHGAGRAMSRKQALKHWRGSSLVDELKQRGILIRSHTMRGVAEEAPLAYKDVDEVALSTEKAGLARRVALLRPLICVKG